MKGWAGWGRAGKSGELLFGRGRGHCNGGEGEGGRGRGHCNGGEGEGGRAEKSS